MFFQRKNQMLHNKFSWQEIQQLITKGAVAKVGNGFESKLFTKGCNQFPISNNPHLLQHLTKSLAFSLLPLQGSLKSLVGNQFCLDQDISQLLFLIHFGKGAVLAQ